MTGKTAPPHFRVFPLDESPGYLIHCLDNLLSAGLNRSFRNAGFDITPEQWGVLSRLWEEEGLHQSALAARTSKDRHNMARILQLMEKRGLIARMADPNDKRRQRVYLSSLGRSLKEELIGLAENYLESCFGHLAREEVSAMQRIHKKIIRVAEQLES